jgi:hypothetical protein
MTPEKDEFRENDTGNRTLPSSAAGPLPNRIFGAEIPLSAGSLRIAQGTDL